MRVNEQGAYNIAQASAAQTSPPVLVLVSSLAAAGPSPENRPRHEFDPACPVSNYGRSKRAGELAAARFADRVSLPIVRPPIVFRRGIYPARYVPPDKVAQTAPGARIYCAAASMIHAADLVAGFVRQLNAAKGSQPTRPTTPPRAILSAAEHNPTLAEFGPLRSHSLGCRRLLVHAHRITRLGLWQASTKPGDAFGTARTSLILIRFARQPRAPGFACQTRSTSNTGSTSATILRPVSRDSHGTHPPLDLANDRRTPGMRCRLWFTLAPWPPGDPAHAALNSDAA